MSTKINVRSPYYLNFTEPALPSVAFDCSVANGTGLEVDQFGNVTLPRFDYGDIVSYTCSDSDFADGKFNTVSVSTSRDIVFTLTIPDNFSNANLNTFNCTLSATQPVFSCTGGVTTNGTIPAQSLDSGGNSATIDLASYFTAGADPISRYKVTNTNTSKVVTSIDGNTLTLNSLNQTGTVTIFVEAIDDNPLTCNATQSISVTVSSAITYTCNDARFVGGSIANDGTIVKPTANGTVGDIKLTDGGSPITSYSANSTGSSREVTLFFEITIPTGVGYTNGGSTIDCSKTFTQSSVALPEFTCGVAGLTNQAVYTNGTIVKGTANVGTISGFSPLNFNGSITSDTPRDVTYTITPPSSGYSNSGGSDISCTITLTQPAPLPPTGNIKWTSTLGMYAPRGNSAIFYFLTTQDYQTYTGFSDSGLSGFRALEPRLASQNNRLVNTNGAIYLEFNNPLSLVGSFISLQPNGPVADFRIFHNTMNPTGGFYARIAKTNYYPEDARISDIHNVQGGTDYWIKVERSSMISEVWSVHLINKTFTRLA